ncbi:MAG: methyltransferase type 11 [Gammaproteobacteria bacterium]|nr:MAG: methyltransferase type 11 [Gammaproteobacteria bacterium]
MHASSLENMQKCYEKYLGQSTMLLKPLIKVLDIGGADINGSYADIFSDDKFQYIAADLDGGAGVDVKLDDPYELPFDDGSFDIVVSGQVFEHVEFFWKLFEEIMRVVNKQGFVFLIVPSAGPIHRFPVDCYRFYPDSMRALARYAQVELVECWHDNRGPWNDIVAVFVHGVFASEQACEALPTSLPKNRFMEETEPVTTHFSDMGPEFEAIAGATPYLDVLARIHAGLKPRHYLEIGVRKGNSLALASCKAVGVDPDADLESELAKSTTLYTKTSDCFFEENAPNVLADKEQDLIFIDGMHLFEFALRDFIHAEQYSSNTTLILIDDIFPNHSVQAQRKRQSRVWTGDVWKLYHCLKYNRPDLILLPIDTAPTGLLLVLGLNPANKKLLQTYNPLVRKYRNMPLVEDNALIMGRQDAISPDDKKLDDLLGAIKQERNAPIGAGALKKFKQLLGL